MANKLQKGDWELKIKSGAILSDSERVTLEAIARKYEKDFEPFLSTLASSVPFRNMPEQIAKDLRDTSERMKVFIDKVKNISLARGVISEEDLGLLSYSRQYIEDKIVAFKTLQEQNNHFKDITTSLTEKTGVSFEKMETTHATVTSRLSGMGKGSMDKFRTKHPEVYGLGSNLGKSVLGAFGPYGQLVSLIGNTIGNYRKRAIQERTLRETEDLASQLLPSGETSTKEYGILRKNLLGTELGGILKPESLYGYQNKGINPAGILNRTMSKSSIFNSLNEAGAGLFSFFNNGWKKAFWTKRILELLGEKDKKEEKKDSALGSLAGIFNGLKDSLFPALKTIAKVAGPALAVAGAGVAGWTAGRFIGENVKWGGKTLDKHTQGFFQHTLFGGDEKDRLRKIANENPLISEAIKLQMENPGMTPGEAAKTIQVRNAINDVASAGTSTTIKPILEKNLESELFNPINNLKKNPLESSKSGLNLSEEFSVNTKNMSANIEEMLKEIKSSNKKSIPIVLGDPDEISALNKGNLTVS